MRTMTVLMTMLAMGAAANAAADTGSKACSILSDIVYRQVLGVDRTGGRTTTLPTRVPGPTVCHQTASAVSAGFSRAMAERNLYITWSTPEDQRRFICLSVDLSQCFPNQDPFVPPMSLYDAAFVVQQWNAVQKSVSAMMPAGTASDVSRFDPALAGTRLQQQLGRDAIDRRVFD